MFARIFDYRDEADLQIFGVNLSAVEATWDGFLRYLVGSYDLLNIGFGGLISAAPGGVRTFSYDELSGGRSVGEVWRGEMEPGDAPSPGQIAITAIGIEAARIRNGEARLSDILLLNPATAPFILAGLAAETSPLQQEGFDLLDREQREEAFSQGYEKWMSGITDAGLMLADPLIGAGVGIKLARKGLLGTPGGLRESIYLGRHVDDQVNEVLSLAGVTGRTSDDIITEYRRIADERTRRIQEGTSLDEVTRGFIPEESPVLGGRVTTATDTSALDGTVGGFIADVVRVKEDGTKVMSIQDITSRLEIRANPMAGTIGSLLHQTTDPVIAGLLIKASSGTPKALDDLRAIAPALEDVMFQAKREHYAIMARTEPQKTAEVKNTLSRTIDNVQQELDFVEASQRKLLSDQTLPAAIGNKIDNVSAGKIDEWMAYEQRRLNLQATIDEATELYQVADGAKILDRLDYTSPFYNEAMATRIIDDIHRSSDVVTQALNRRIAGTAAEARVRFPTKNNPYSRRVMRKREARGRARSQYLAEGTSIFPRMRPVKSEDGKIIYQSDGWFSPSEFPGTSRWQRNARVWRWIGEENPSGWLGLKGTSTVGSEAEFTAALKLDMYKGEGVKVRQIVDDPAKGPGATRVEEITVGGSQRREQLFQEFYAALNNPDADSYKALMNVEDAITRDLALIYNQPENALLQVVGRGKRLREQHMDNIRKHGYFVDEFGEKHHVPWLEVHSANGTYMQNFMELEKILKREARKDGGRSLRGAFEVPQQLASSAYNTFNNFWRPATLMRLSYTQRNVFENMIRAMAYNASLAPMLWPVRATVNGTRNKLMAGRVPKRAAKAQARVDDSTYGRLVREHNEAASELGVLERHFEFRAEGAKESVIHVMRRQPDGSYQPQTYTQREFERAYTRQQKAVDEAEAAMRANVEEFDNAVKGTEFGTWREKEIKALEDARAAKLNEIDGLTELLSMPDANGRLMQLAENPALVRQLGELTDMGRVIDMKLERLKYWPQDAIAEYQQIAGRQKRIGSGTSIGPDGNFYNDAFTGPYEQINRALMSSDNTIKQQLSLSYNVWDSLFRRMMVKSNEAIRYSPATRDAWAQGMVSTIDDLASSAIVRRLINNGMDIDDTVKWLRFDPEGQDFYRKISLMFGDSADNPASIARAMGDPDVYITVSTATGVQRKRLKAFGEEIETPSGAKMTVYDSEATLAYVNDVANKIQTTMQQQEAFMALLRRRVSEIDRAPEQITGAVPGTRVSGIDAETVKAAIDSLPPNVQNSLTYVLGDEMIQMGTKGFMDLWATGVNKVFRVLGQIPEDAVARGPFYNDRFKATRNVLIEQYWANQGIKAADLKKRKKAKTKEGREQGNTIAHDEFTIPADELSQITVTAHRQALKDVREWMYTIERRTNLGKYGEWIFPFVSAAQNSTIAFGKLLYKEPWLAPLIADMWRMPTRLGIEDENGNLLMPMPPDMVRKFLQDNPDIPVIGGVLDAAAKIRMPKMGINVIAPETGYGVIPRPTPWVQVGASELMKANAFPIETPQLLRNALGNEAADELYGTVKDYVFGEGSGVSSMFGSIDKLIPAYVKRGLESRQELSRQYGQQYMLHYHTEMARWRGGERDAAPTEEEIRKRTSNTFWFMLLGNIGVPTPLTPYPILTRPQIDNPVTAMQEMYRQYQQADPLNASYNFRNQFGDWALEMANSKITVNVGGAEPRPEVISDIKTFDSLIRKAAPLVGDDLSVLGILTNNRLSQVDYETSAYRWQSSQRIPGTNRTWREVQSPEMSTAERQRITGWTVYRQAMDQLDAKLENAGLTSYESAGAAELKAAKTRLVANMMQNPDYAGWVVDFQDRGGARAQAAVRTMELAIADETFRNELIKSGNEQVYGIMSEYVYYRRGIINLLQRSGTSINNPDNIQLKIAWDTMRQRWKNRSVRWAEIHDLYLSSDDNPVSPGSFIGEVAMASGVQVVQ